MDSELNQNKIYIVGSIKNKEGIKIQNKFERSNLIQKTQLGDYYQFINVETKEVFISKVIPKNKMDTQKIRQQVIQEIRIYQQIEHKNILKLQGTFEDQDFVYILLDEFKYTLNDYLKLKGKLSEDKAKQFIIQISDALNYLHQNNIIHRDLKLSNIYFSKDKQIKIGGFNYSIKLEQKNERRKSICGTSRFIAPEILQNDNGYSFQVDLWYLGIIFYTLLFGVHPFEASNIQIAYQNIKAKKYIYREDVAISEKIKNIIDQLLNSDPNMRGSIDKFCEIIL